MLKTLKFKKIIKMFDVPCVSVCVSHGDQVGTGLMGPKHVSASSEIMYDACVFCWFYLLIYDNARNGTHKPHATFGRKGQIGPVHITKAYKRSRDKVSLVLTSELKRGEWPI